MSIFKNVVVFILLVGGLAQANDGVEAVPASLRSTKVKFGFNSRNSFYHCDFVKAETKAILRKMGAVDIVVNCSGGLPDYYGNFIEASFQSPRVATADKATHMATMSETALQFKSSCDLHASIVGHLLSEFEADGLEQDVRCWDSNGRANYKMNLLKLVNN